MFTLRRLGVAVSPLLLCAAFSAAPAYAADCSVEHIDSDGEVWDLNSDGTISDGTNDTYDTFGYAGIDTDNDDSFENYSNPDSTGCTYEDGDREVVFPADTDADGLELSRKVYVPSTGLGFGRWLDIVRNPTAADVTFDYRFEGNLGLDSDTEVTGSSDGDTIAEVGDTWVAMDEDDFEDTKVTQLWDLPRGPDAFDRFGSDGPPGNGEDDVELIYDDITIPAGATMVFIHVDHQSGSRNEGLEWGREHGQGEEDFYSGLSAAETSQLRNAPPFPDRDSDGVRDGNDNCITVANADQADLDGDSRGDACDDDIDGDGLTNAQEANMGTDPRKADTDGDGRPDGVDQCPTLAGTSANGCPVFAAAQPSAQAQPQALRRLVAQRVTTSVKTARVGSGLRVRTSGSVRLPAGLARADACKGKVTVQLKVGKKTVSTRTEKLSSTCRYSSSVLFRLVQRLDRPKLSAVVRFRGNTRLLPRRAPRQTFNNPLYRSSRG